MKDKAVKSGPIRVVHVIARMNVGGPAILISELIKGLKAPSFESYLITGYCEPNEVDYLEANRLELKEIRINGFGRSISLIQDLRSLFQIARTLRRLQPDIVHTHTAKAGVIGRLTSIIAVPGAKRIHTYHGHLLNGYFSKFKTRLLILVERILAKKTDLILTVGNQVRSDLLKAGIGQSDRMFVTFPGIKVTEQTNREEIRKQLSLNESAVVLIYVGRLTKIKRSDRLIEAFKSASRELPELTLLMVGDGELRSVLEEQAVGLPIKFLGWRTDVYGLMAASDIAILTSDNEGMPITLIEAAHLGLPSISTEVGSVADVVRHAETGYLTNLEPSVITERIKQLAISYSLRKKFGAAAQEHARKHFSVESMIEFHKKTYEDLLN